MKWPVFLGFAPARNGIFCASFMSACKQMGLMWNRFFLFIHNNLVFQVHSSQKHQYSGPGGPHLSALDKLIYFSNSITTHCRERDTCTPTHSARYTSVFHLAAHVCQLSWCIKGGGRYTDERAGGELDRWIKEKRNVSKAVVRPHQRKLLRCKLTESWRIKNVSSVVLICWGVIPSSWCRECFSSGEADIFGRGRTSFFLIRLVFSST